MSWPTFEWLPLPNSSHFSDLLASFVFFSDAYRHCFLCMYSDRSSVQDNERKRCTTGTLPIEYSSLDPASQFPNDMTTIWPSNNNKLLLEKLIYNHLLSDISLHGQYPILDSCKRGRRLAMHWYLQWQEGYTIISSAHLRKLTFAALHVLYSLKSGQRDFYDATIALLYHRFPT